MNKSLISKIIDDYCLKSIEFKNSIEEKGKYKYILIYHLLNNLIKIKNINPIILIEVYNFFIRSRTFIFREINKIEDCLSSNYIDINSTKPKHHKINFMINKTFNNKKNKFIEENFYIYFTNKYNLNSNFENLKDFQERIYSLIHIRNWISHLDLFYLNLSINLERINKQQHFFNKINDYIISINCFNEINSSNSFSQAWNDIKLNSHIKDVKIKNELNEIIEKILNYSFQDKDLFL